MDLAVTRSSLLPNALVARSGILMTSSLCLLALRLDLCYKILFHKMVSSMVWTLLRYVSSMVMYGFPLFRSFANN